MRSLIDATIEQKEGDYQACNHIMFEARTLERSAEIQGIMDMNQPLLERHAQLLQGNQIPGSCLEGTPVLRACGVGETLNQFQRCCVDGEVNLVARLEHVRYLVDV